MIKATVALFLAHAIARSLCDSCLYISGWKVTSGTSLSLQFPVNVTVNASAGLPVVTLASGNQQIPVTSVSAFAVNNQVEVGVAGGLPDGWMLLVPHGLFYSAVHGPLPVSSISQAAGCPTPGQAPAASCIDSAAPASPPANSSSVSVKAVWASFSITFPVPPTSGSMTITELVEGAEVYALETSISVQVTRGPATAVVASSQAGVIYERSLLSAGGSSSPSTLAPFAESQTQDLTYPSAAEVDALLVSYLAPITRLDAEKRVSYSTGQYDGFLRWNGTSWSLLQLNLGFTCIFDTQCLATSTCSHCSWTQYGLVRNFSDPWQVSAAREGATPVASESVRVSVTTAGWSDSAEGLARGSSLVTPSLSGRFSLGTAAISVPPTSSWPSRITSPVRGSRWLNSSLLLPTTPCHLRTSGNGFRQRFLSCNLDIDDLCFQSPLTASTPELAQTNTSSADELALPVSGAEATVTLPASSVTFKEPRIACTARSVGAGLAEVTLTNLGTYPGFADVTVACAAGDPGSTVSPASAIDPGVPRRVSVTGLPSTATLCRVTASIRSPRARWSLAGKSAQCSFTVESVCLNAAVSLQVTNTAETSSRGAVTITATAPQIASVTPISIECNTTRFIPTTTAASTTTSSSVEVAFLDLAQDEPTNGTAFSCTLTATAFSGSCTYPVATLTFAVSNATTPPSSQSPAPTSAPSSSPSPSSSPAARLPSGATSPDEAPTKTPTPTPDPRRIPSSQPSLQHQSQEQNAFDRLVSAITGSTSTSKPVKAVIALAIACLSLVAVLTLVWALVAIRRRLNPASAQAKSRRSARLDHEHLAGQVLPSDHPAAAEYLVDSTGVLVDFEVELETGDWVSFDEEAYTDALVVSGRLVDPYRPHELSPFTITSAQPLSRSSFRFDLETDSLWVQIGAQSLRLDRPSLSFWSTFVPISCRMRSQAPLATEMR